MTRTRNPVNGQYVSKEKIEAAGKFFEDMNREQIDSAITEWLSKNAWIEDEPEQKQESTHIQFSRGINTGVLVTAVLVWMLLTVLIVYVGVRI